MEQIDGAPKLVRGTGVRSLKVGDTLRSGDSLTTGPEDEIALRYPDGSELRLTGDTSISLLAEGAREAGLKF